MLFLAEYHLFYIKILFSKRNWEFATTSDFVIHISLEGVTATNKNVKIRNFPIKPKHLGNFPYTQAFGKFPRYPDIWEISQVPRNFPDTQAFGKFPWYPGNWEISQIPGFLGNPIFDIFDNCCHSLLLIQVETGYVHALDPGWDRICSCSWSKLRQDIFMLLIQVETR